MAIIFIPTDPFKKTVNKLVHKGNLLTEDLDELKLLLAKNPTKGDLISGTGGMRKIRIKSASRGKSGGFRICYYYYVIGSTIYLFAIYPKNDQTDLTPEEKKLFKIAIKSLN